MPRLRAFRTAVRSRWTMAAAVLVPILVAACNNGGSGPRY